MMQTLWFAPYDKWRTSTVSLVVCRPRQGRAYSCKTTTSQNSWPKNG